MILAVFYPSGPLSVIALATLMTAAVLAALWLRRRRVRSFWPYVIGPGVAVVGRALLWRLSSGPGVGADRCPSCRTARGILGCSIREKRARSTRSISSSTGGRCPCNSCCCSLAWRLPASRSNRLGRARTSCWLGLLFGKPIGILLFSGAARLAGARLPRGLRLADLVVVGITAAIGFTVSLFFATAAFPAGAALAETKMGALLSFGAAPLALVASRLLRVRTT